ncbi:MAG: SHOCT domain-containing protein [Acidimicrobiales bacterium]|nr:SHOCT domain-containing protein [Acidimicrobiales bacterium]
MTFEEETDLNNETSDNALEELEQLARLREKGVLTEEEFESQKSRILGKNNDDGEKEVRDPNLVESPEIDPEIYLQLTSNQRKRVEETPSKQQKELIDSFLKQNNKLPEIRNKTQKKKPVSYFLFNPKELSSFGKILRLLIYIGFFVVLWQVGFIHWGSDRLTNAINYFLDWFDRRIA